MEHVNRAYKGETIRIAWTLQLLAGKPRAAAPYTIVVDPRVWLIVARRNGTVQLDPNNPQRVECALIAVTSGHLPLPTLRLEGHPDDVMDVREALRYSFDEFSFSYAHIGAVLARVGCMGVSAPSHYEYV